MKVFEINQVDQSLKTKIDACNTAFKNLKDMIRVELYESNEKIINANQPINDMRYFVEGKAKIRLVHENGRESIVDFIRPGDYIGELTFLEIEKEPKDVITLSQCICLSIPISIAKTYLLNDEVFLLELSRRLAEKHMRRTWFYVKSLRYEFRNRLAAYILMTEDQGIYRERHTETSELLGVSYRHLLHTVKELQEDGLLTKTGKGYLIHREGLTEMAKDINYY